MAADRYWLERLRRDRALARRTADQVSAEVRRAYRSQYLQVARGLDQLYAEAQRTGTLSRTKLWNYRRWREMEPQLRRFCEAQNVIQRDAITRALDRVFEDVIGADVERFGQDRFLLRYDPRAVIDTAWSGENYSSRIWGHTSELAERIRTEAQQIVMGEKSPGTVKRQLMRDFDVAYHQAERLVDTEISYVMNRANLEQYKGHGVQKVEIVCLDVNTCEKCKAVEGEVFSIIDAPVLPIHPRCHCSYCVPEAGDAAEVTASGGNLDEVYARKGVKGYERPRAAGAKQYAPKGASPGAAAQTIPASKRESQVAEALESFEQPKTALEKTAKNPENTPANVLQEYLDRPAREATIITRESGYDEERHEAEVKDAEVLIKKLGGAITLRKEINKDNTPTPDYTWDGKDWEQKSVSSPTSIDNAIRKGAKQISENPGGIVLNIGNHELSEDEIQRAINKRFKRTKLTVLDVIIIKNGKIWNMLRFKKT